MSAHDNGGAAFPIPNDDRPGAYPAEPGMTLRDYFAAKALMALDVQAHVARPAAEHLARSAYNIADAMLKVRQAPTTDTGGQR